MIQRYDPRIGMADYTCEPEAEMVKCNWGDFVRHDAHIREITKLQERIAELEIARESGFHGDV